MRKITSIGITALTIATLGAGVAAPIHAQTATPTPSQGRFGHFRGMDRVGMMRPGVFGTVTAINGSTITLTSMQRPNMAQTTYTVDATNATITKNKTKGAITDIAVGDVIIVQGTVNGTSVTATAIRDGQFKRQGNMMPKAMPFGGQQGNGQPIIAGTITAINGSSLTLTNKGTTTYTIDVTNAKVSKNNKDGSVSDIAVNDSVIVQGTINGNNVTAVSVIDHSQPAAPTSNNTSNSTPAPRIGFFGRIGQFFAHIFGF